MSRWSWLGINLAVTAWAVVVIMAVVGAATGVGAAIVTGDGEHVWELTLAHLNQVPAVLVVLGIAALLFGVLPRAIPATWVVIGYGLVVGTFGPMLDLPDTAHDLSPFAHPAELPLESFTVAPLLTLTALAAAAAVVGLLAFRRRDIDAT